MPNGKYRGWTIKTNRRVEGYHCVVEGKHFIVLDDAELCSTTPDATFMDGICGMTEVQPESVGQCTSTKDKKDKEIYKGDVVKRYREDAPENCKKYNGAIGVIKYSLLGVGGFEIVLVRGKEWSFYYPDGDNFGTEDLEVIGNAWEHPHLLEAKDE